MSHVRGAIGSLPELFDSVLEKCMKGELDS